MCLVNSKFKKKRNQFLFLLSNIDLAGTWLFLVESQKPVIIDKFALRLVISQYNPEGKKPGIR